MEKIYQQIIISSDEESPGKRVTRSSLEKIQRKKVIIDEPLEEEENEHAIMICLNDGLSREEIKQLKQLTKRDEISITRGENRWYDIYESIEILETLANPALKATFDTLKEDVNKLTRGYNNKHKKLMKYKRLLNKVFD